MTLKRAAIIVLTLTVASLAAAIHAQLKMEQTNLRIQNILDEMQRCARVDLLSSREDVLQVMGKPVKEEIVRSITGGAANRLYFQYSMVKVDHLPYVDIDQHFRKVVAVDCAFTRHSLRTLIKKGQAQMPKDEALPTDRKRY